MMKSLQLRALSTGATTAIFALFMGVAISLSATEPPKKSPPPQHNSAPRPPQHNSTPPPPHNSGGGGGARPNNYGGGARPNNYGGGAHPNNPGGTGGATGSHNVPANNNRNFNNGSNNNRINNGNNNNGGNNNRINNGNINNHNISNGGNNNSHNVNINNHTTINTHNTIGGYARTPVGAHVRTVGNATVITRANGHIGVYSNPARGITVHNNLNGGFHGTVFHPDHSGVYFARGRAGYYQRPYSWHGHDFDRRSYYWHGHPYFGYYHGWGWRGGFYNVYAPGFFFGAGFYGWAYNPWYRPIGWGWGWGGAPWYGYYGGWFTPYPTYAAPAFWLTDYIISQNLEAAYAARQEGGEQIAAGGEGVMLTPEVKDQIAEEVRNQIALENQEAQQTAQGQAIDPGSSGIGRLMTDGRHHIFVASSGLDVVDAGSGQECALSDGDVLQLATDPDPQGSTADLVVLASKGGNECQRGSTVTVNFSDLQEMQNSMRMNLDNGLKELQSRQGTGGLPPAPPSAQTAPVQAPYAAVAPPPEPSDEQQIQQQQQAAQQDLQQAQSQTQQ